jgi:hypothetical protein
VNLWKDDIAFLPCCCSYEHWAILLNYLTAIVDVSFFFFFFFLPTPKYAFPPTPHGEITSYHTY